MIVSCITGVVWALILAIKLQIPVEFLHKKTQLPSLKVRVLECLSARASVKCSCGFMIKYWTIFVISAL